VAGIAVKFCNGFVVNSRGSSQGNLHSNFGQLPVIFHHDIELYLIARMVGAACFGGVNRNYRGFGIGGFHKYAQAFFRCIAVNIAGFYTYEVLAGGQASAHTQGKGSVNACFALVVGKVLFLFGKCLGFALRGRYQEVYRFQFRFVGDPRIEGNIVLLLKSGPVGGLINDYCRGLDVGDLVIITGQKDTGQEGKNKVAEFFHDNLLVEAKKETGIFC
jgi:hypothetical protein